MPTAPNMSVIHKHVIDLNTVMFLPQISFEVPQDAEMVDIQWDTRNPEGVGLWFRTHLVPGEYSGPIPTKMWKFIVRGTGQPFPEEARHMATVVRNGYAWHILDAEGQNVEWAEA